VTARAFQSLHQLLNSSFFTVSYVPQLMAAAGALNTTLGFTPSTAPLQPSSAMMQRSTGSCKGSRQHSSGHKLSRVPAQQVQGEPWPHPHCCGRNWRHTGAADGLARQHFHHRCCAVLL